MDVAQTRGDVLRLHLRIDGTHVREVKWKCTGCSASLAAASTLAVLLEGVDLAEARTVDAERISDALGGLPRLSRHVGDLAADAVQAALDDYDARRPR